MLAGCQHRLQPGTVLDEARQANRGANSFPAADEDYFRDMDGGITAQPDPANEHPAWVKGRNTWIVWT
ncbi:MAG: hypothetical protein M3Z85_18500, partial [Acidobacteriota bacterium]|nr:hypothetical protein [Acidobacteriota bacterium]